MKIFICLKNWLEKLCKSVLRILKDFNRRYTQCHILRKVYILCSYNLVATGVTKMKLKLRKLNADGMIRVETGGEIKEVLINEDILHPNNESISVCYQGKNSSGIIDFSPEEIEKLYSSVKKRMHLIKGFKVLGGK